MEPVGIVPEFDVPSDVTPGVFPGRVDSAVNEFVFQGREERFGHGIIVADTGAADRVAQVEFGDGDGEVL